MGKGCWDGLRAEGLGSTARQSSIFSKWRPRTALGKRQDLCGLRVANKALGFFSFFLALSLFFFCTQQVNLVSSEMGMVAWSFGTAYSFFHLLPWTLWWVRVREAMGQSWHEVSLHRSSAQVASNPTVSRTGQTDRKADRATHYLAQTRPNELTIESLFFVPVSIFSLKTN